MPTLAERLETATTTLEGLVANTTGTGDIVLKNSPTLVTPTLGVASATSITVANYINATNAGIETASIGTAYLNVLLLETDGSISQGGYTLTMSGSVSFGAMGRTLAATADAADARTAMGAGTSSFDPASPGAIGTTTPNSGSFTAAYMGDSAYRYVIVSNTPYFTGQNHVQFDSTKISGKDASSAEKFSLTYGTGAAMFTTLSIGANAIAIGGNMTFSGAYATTFTVTGTTTLTLPTSGTLATTAAGTSTATGLVREWLRAGIFWLSGLTETKNGTASATVANAFGYALQSGTQSTTGYAARRSAQSNNVAILQGKAAGVIPWAAGTIEGEVLLIMEIGWDAGSVFRLHIGRTAALLTGNTAHASHPNSFEIRYEAGVALKVIGANASATKSETSSFTPTLGIGFRLRWKVSGGTILVYVNGTLVATNTGGPTADSSSTANSFCMIVENGTVAVSSEAKTSIPTLDIY